MSVQDDVRTVTIPRPAEPVDPPLVTTPAPAPPASTVGVPGRDRRLTKDERLFVLGMAGVFGWLSVYIVTFLLLAQYVWS